MLGRRCLDQSAFRRQFSKLSTSKYKFPNDTIVDILKKPVNSTATANGWVRSVRLQKNLAFVEINDGSTGRGLQAVLKPEMAKDLHTGASVCLTGQLVLSPGKEQSKELKVSDCRVYGLANPEVYPLHKGRVSFDYLREHGHFRSRSKTFGAIWRIRNTAILGLQQFFQSHRFVQAHTPVLTSNDCEGAGEVFRVMSNESLKAYIKERRAYDSSPFDKSLPLPTREQVAPGPSEFFNHAVYLTVSGQLHAEMLASAMSRVYTLGPTFRAEPSLSSRHLAEFWMLEAEMAYITQIGELLDFIEACIRETTAFVLERSEEDIAFCTKWLDKDLPSRLAGLTSGQPFARVTYGEAVEILSNMNRVWEYPVQWGLALQSEHERYLAEEHFKGPVFVTDYPKCIKPFYMRASAIGERSADAQETVACVDLLVPKIGELVGGSLREDNPDILEQSMRHAGLDLEEYGWYLDLRRFGTVPHGGFGLGFERYLAYITGMATIRDLILAPRWLGHCRY
ncbi:asparagine---tRNA ligase [Spizellomyces sp. 'palustris']|nr:asparagine---tRNA ligase [Spizellomyces sp. 'palustris']